MSDASIPVVHSFERWIPSTLCLAILLLSSGCGKPEPPGGPTTITPGTTTGAGPVGSYKIVTTCAMVTDIVASVAGDHAEVTGLIGEGIDPHLFTAGRNDVQKLLEADVVFYSGLMLEGRMADNFAQVGRKGKQVFAVTEGIDRDLLREPPEFDGHWDPHVWMDVSMWSQSVDFVADALSEYDTANAESYQANADALRSQLAELHNYCGKVIGSVPEKSRYLVTAHDAFGYFAAAYGIQVKAIQGISTESEANVAGINDLVQFICDNEIPAIFVESSVSSANIKAVIDGCAGRGWEVRIGAELYSDAMGAPGTYEGTYIGMMDHNATQIARALGGEAPELGWQEKLAADAAGKEPAAE